METQDPKWMVLKSVSLVPVGSGGLLEMYRYRADWLRYTGDEIISKDLTMEEAKALAKIMQ